MKTGFLTCPDAFGTHRMAYVEWGAPSVKPSIICVHGLTRNGRDFDRLAAALAEAGRHVICPDIVGRGRSDDLSAHPELYAYEQYIADLLLLIKDKGLAQVHWVGTSMGGLMGMMIAAMPQSPITKLVINDVGPFIPLVALQRIATYVAMLVEFADKPQLERHMRQIYAPFGIARDEDWALMVENGFWKLPNGKLVLSHDPAIAQNFGKLDKDVDLWPVYEAITCPVLLLRGAVSDVLSAETATAMTQRGPKAQLITYSNVGHAPALMDEKQIEDVKIFVN